MISQHLYHKNKLSINVSTYTIDTYRVPYTDSAHLYYTREMTGVTTAPLSCKSFSPYEQARTDKGTEDSLELPVNKR